MSRWVEPVRPDLVAGDSGNRAEELTQRIVKYIPSEVLAAYTACILLVGALALPTDPTAYTAIALIVAFLLATVVYIFQVAPATDNVRRAHLVISPVAFVAWSYPIAACLLDSYFKPLIAFWLLVGAVLLSLIAPRP